MSRCLTAAALLLLLLAVPAARAGADPTRAAQRDFVLRHYFMGPSETSGWASTRPSPAVSEGRVLGPFRPTYFTPEGERRRGDRTAAQLAALDLEVEPPRAQVLVGEQPVGRAKRFDGLPRWLWLEPGPTTLTFVLPGGDTVTKSFELDAGSVQRLDARLD